MNVIHPWGSLGKILLCTVFVPVLNKPGYMLSCFIEYHSPISFLSLCLLFV